LPWFVKENRRTAARHRYDGNSTWIQLEGSLTRQCQILDLSRTGVRLRVTNAHSLPNTFALVLSKNSGGSRPARVKWRRGNEVGAEFFKAESSLVSRSTADAPRAEKSHEGEGHRSKSPMSTLSLHSRTQRPDAAKVKADPRKVVGGISDDRAKTDALGQTADCSEQLDRAGQEKNRKKSVDFSRLHKKLGPDHVALIHALKDVDPESPHGRELALIIECLNKNP
jgi:hypothetical protein